MLSSVPMIAITISSSMSVKPRSGPQRRPRVMVSPGMIGNPVQSLAGGQRIYVEDVITGLRVIRRTLVAAQPPGLVRRHRTVRKERIARHAAQEVQIDFLFARRVLDAAIQRFQIRRIPGGPQFLLDVPG